MSAGDTVYLRSGTYGEVRKEEEKVNVLEHAGTALAPISWLRYPGDAQPTFLGSMRLSGAYNRISGLLFQGPSGPIKAEKGQQEVLVWLNATGDRLDHSEVRESAWHAGVYVSNAKSFSIDHDYIHNNGNNEQPNLDHGIYVSSGSSGTIENDLVAENFVYGIQLYPNANEVTINHNTIVNNGRGGVIVANESANDLVVNNIVANNNEYGIRAYELTGSGNKATDNLVWNQTLNTTGTGMTFSETTAADPKFVSESNFHLQSSSPAIEKGTSPTVADDIEGVTRGTPSDLGAYEFVAPLPEFRSAASASANASTTLTINKPSGVVAGDVLVAEVNNRGGAAVSSTGWTQIRDTFRGASDHMTTFYKVAGASEPASYTFTSTDPYGKAGGIAAWENVDTSAPVAASSGNSGSGTTVTASGVTTVDPNSPLLFVAGVMDQTTATPPSGFTERWDIASAGEYKATAESASVLQAEVGASGNKSASAGSAGGGWAAQLIALNPL